MTRSSSATVSHRRPLVSQNDQSEVADGPSGNPSISGDGRFVAFQSQSTNLTPNYVPGCPGYALNTCVDVYVRDRQASATVLVSTTDAGDQGNSHSSIPSISLDGFHSAFISL